MASPHERSVLINRDGAGSDTRELEEMSGKFQRLEQHTYGRLDSALVAVAAYAIEFLGTLVLVLAITTSGDAVLAPLGIGFTLMILVFWGGHISGGMYNVAVSVGVLLAGRGKLAPGRAGVYILVQLLGGLCGAFLGLYLTGNVSYPGSLPSFGKILVAEGIWTFTLLSVILNVATVEANDGNSYYGLAIGGTVVAGAVIMGPISGGIFNPAVAVGLFFADLASGGHPKWQLLLIDIGAELAGAAAAALFFRMTNAKEYTLHQLTK
eukprot:TRINITY_DN2504_c0_g1_i1.p1 TRINITY_DN2504_c0_g1~~TRINITY_DN2504_c0_g1_i1.p1  ORF type:complete len:266 (-),score=22.11 TRINITY_DN2504_c0_g1_i1:56-853(-)